MKEKLLLIVAVFIINYANSQTFTMLKDGADTEIDGMLVSYNVIKKGTKKGSDLYRLTATVTNQNNNYMRIFENAIEAFSENPDFTLAYFQFTNANGKAFSSTSARFYPKPLYINVPYSCKKCKPVAKDEDPENHYNKQVVIGTQFPVGSTISKVYNIRVPEGEIPTVKVMIY